MPMEAHHALFIYVHKKGVMQIPVSISTQRNLPDELRLEGSCPTLGVSGLVTQL